MTENDPTGPETGKGEDQRTAAARRNRGVRFSDLEWEEVKQVAETLGVTPAEFVRERILDLIRNPVDADSVAIPANLAALIERTFRYTYMLATRMRAEMIEHGKAEELDKLVSEARALQDDLDAPRNDSPHHLGHRAQRAPRSDT